MGPVATTNELEQMRVKLSHVRSSAYRRASLQMSSSDEVPSTPTHKQRPRLDCRALRVQVPSLPMLTLAGQRRRKKVMETMAISRLLPRTLFDDLASLLVTTWRIYRACSVMVRRSCREQSGTISMADSIKMGIHWLSGSPLLASSV